MKNTGILTKKAFDSEDYYSRKFNVLFYIYIEQKKKDLFNFDINKIYYEVISNDGSILEADFIDNIEERDDLIDKIIFKYAS